MKSEGPAKILISLKMLFVSIKKVLELSFFISLNKNVLLSFLFFKFNILKFSHLMFQNFHITVFFEESFDMASSGRKEETAKVDKSLNYCKEVVWRGRREAKYYFADLSSAGGSLSFSVRKMEKT